MTLKIRLSGEIVFGCNTIEGEEAQANLANVKLSIKTNSRLRICVGIQLSLLSNVTLICHVPLKEGLDGKIVLSCASTGNRSPAHQSGGIPFTEIAPPPIDILGVRGQQKKAVIAPSTNIENIENTIVLDVALL